MVLGTQTYVIKEFVIKTLGSLATACVHTDCIYFQEMKCTTAALSTAGAPPPGLQFYDWLLAAGALSTAECSFPRMGRAAGGLATCETAGNLRSRSRIVVRSPSILVAGLCQPPLKSPDCHQSMCQGSPNNVWAFVVPAFRPGFLSASRIRKSYKIVSANLTVGGIAKCVGFERSCSRIISSLTFKSTAWF